MKSRNRTRVRLEDGNPKITGNQLVNPEKAALARRFRRGATAREAEVWTLVRDRAILGLKFRRQQVIEGFIVDFYCPALRIALEIDGPVHEENEQKSYDRERTTALEQRGIRIIRIANEDVTRSRLEQLLREAVPSPF